MNYYIQSLQLFILLFILGPIITNAQTIEVSDTIKINTTWNADTVKVIDDITVEKEVILTIEPGTTVEFQGHFKLTVLGTLLAIGTAEQNIVFTVHDTTGFYNLETKAGGWNGIRFDESTFTSYETKLRHCVLKYGKATDGDAGT